MMASGYVQNGERGIFVLLVFSNFMSADSIPNPVVRWEILKGLPSEGPIPKYFHKGHPTPWAEGFVVRFWNEDGTEWVGNFQGGSGSIGTVVDSPEATMIVESRLVDHC
jgi:hypothetical protein